MLSVTRRGNNVYVNSKKLHNIYISPLNMQQQFNKINGANHVDFKLKNRYHHNQRLAIRKRPDVKYIIQVGGNPSTNLMYVNKVTADNLKDILLIIE